MHNCDNFNDFFLPVLYLEQNFFHHKIDSFLIWEIHKLYIFLNISYYFKLFNKQYPLIYVYLLSITSHHFPSLNTSEQDPQKYVSLLSIKCHVMSSIKKYIFAVHLLYIIIFHYHTENNWNVVKLLETLRDYTKLIYSTPPIYIHVYI